MEKLYDYYIYRITYIVDGRTYIGKRMMRLWDNYYGSGYHIKNAVRKYGKENFKREIIAEYYNISQIDISNIESEAIKTEWARGHGEFNESCHSYGGDIFDGMPDDKKRMIIDRSMMTNKINHGGVLAWGTKEVRKLATERSYATQLANGQFERWRLLGHSSITEESYKLMLETNRRRNNGILAWNSKDSVLRSSSTRIANGSMSKFQKAGTEAAKNPKSIAKSKASRNKEYNWYYEGKLVYTGRVCSAKQKMNNRNQLWIKVDIDSSTDQ